MEGRYDIHYNSLVDLLHQNSLDRVWAGLREADFMPLYSRVKARCHSHIVPTHNAVTCKQEAKLVHTLLVVHYCILELPSLQTRV